MKEPMCNYVFKVASSAMYQFRRKIPQDLIPHYGKKEIKKSLRTADRREAEKLSRIEASKLDAEWDAIRIEGAKSAADFAESEPEQSTPASIPTAYRDEIYLKNLSVVVTKARADLPRPDLHNVAAYGHWYLAALRAERRLAMETGFYEQFRNHVRDVLSDQEKRLELGLTELRGGDYQHFHVTEAIRNAHIAFLNGDNPTAWSSAEQFKSNGLTVSASKPAKSKVGTSMFELVDKWAAESRRHLKTVDMYNLTAKRFRDLVGVMSIQDIKRTDVVRFKDELIKAGQTPANTNKQLIVVNTLLNYARANALIETNSASGVSIKIEKKQKPRVSFDAIALNAIFSSPVYSDAIRPKAGAGEAAYWLPLLALFTGARIEELGQLHPSDVMEETYFDEHNNLASAWVIRIKHSEEDGQGVKNFGSNRRVPVHSELKRLGFLSYAAAAKSEGQLRIFNELIADKYGTETAQFSKWFNRYLRTTCGVVDTRMTFHSFRHAFKDFCRIASIGVSDKLTGHVTGSVGDSYGTDSYPLHPLVKGITKYRTLGLDLSHLKTAA